MASTYSPNLRLELIGTGEQQGTWGSTTNTNLGTLLEEAIGGYVSVAVTDGADTTLTTINGGADQSRNMTINLTGALTGDRNVICPAIEKLYVVKNATTGGFAVTFKVSGQTGVSVPNGATVFLYVDGTDARAITGSLASQSASNVAITGGTITGITDLALADGGTGASLSDPNANAFLGWNDTAGASTFFTVGSGITVNTTSNTVTVDAGNYVMQTYTNTSPSGVTWTKPAGLKAIKVTVVGGGGGSNPIFLPAPAGPPAPFNSRGYGGSGGGGASVEYIPAPSIPGPVTVTVGAGGGSSTPTASPFTTGGTSSFGSFLSATGGAGGGLNPSGITASGGTGGSGSNGSFNITGQAGGTTVSVLVVPTTTAVAGGGGGSSLMGAGAKFDVAQVSAPYSIFNNASPGGNYGGGASFSTFYNAGAIPPAGLTVLGGTGGQGIVIVEEFY